jgi:hypothetical protein
MWIMVEPVAEIPFRIRRSPTRCYGCNNLEERQGFAQEEFMALDVHKTKECEWEEVEETAEDFWPDNE